jgi:hypothetical protein
MTLETMADGVTVRPGQEFKVDVVDGLAVLKAVDQVQRRTADALDGGQAQLDGAGLNVYRLCALFQRTGIGPVGITHPKRHAASAGAMLRRESRRRGFWARG